MTDAPANMPLFRVERRRSPRGVHVEIRIGTRTDGCVLSEEDLIRKLADVGYIVTRDEWLIRDMLKASLDRAREDDRQARDREWVSAPRIETGGLCAVHGAPKDKPITVGTVALTGTLQSGGSPDGYLSVTDGDGETWRIPYWNALSDAHGEES